MWYEESDKYRFNSPGFSTGTGHFTQIVWVDSTEMGAGIAKSSSGSQFVVHLYTQPSNELTKIWNHVKHPRTSPPGKIRLRQNVLKLDYTPDSMVACRVQSYETDRVSYRPPNSTMLMNNIRNLKTFFKKK